MERQDNETSSAMSGLGLSEQANAVDGEDAPAEQLAKAASELAASGPSLMPTGAAKGELATLDVAREVAERLRARVRDHVLGRDEVIELVLVSMLAGGHILLEDYPGSGKTTLAKALGESIIDDDPHDAIAAFRRVQFTPDLLPSDITGVMIFDTDANNFQFRHGPVFAHVLLVDEINRTSPKVQAALLEAMAESQVTVDNISHRLDELFFVIATQNPLDVAGTYPLPLAQIDRFLFKVRMEHIERDAELAVLDTWGTPKAVCDLPKVERREVLAARAAIRNRVAIDNQIKIALVDSARNLRVDQRVVQGVSTRSLVQAIPALQTLAALRGRDFVSADDLEYLLPIIMWHRVEFVPGTENPAEVILSAAEKPLEALSKGTLRRG
jgi:MoxR-like ATPase